MLETFIGGFAAFCTTVSYIPQVKKAWATHETGDLSLKMLLILSAGLALWIVYGFLKGDWVIIVANGVSLAMLGNLVWFKMHENSGRGG
ncbi:MAG: sugar efflux transporter for intercellular exchange [Hyphomicrobiales bacterium]|jgi:MtN3 and saliva related transmembrane protein|nr:sugar efflux transporter for intercellular exchange [Hyphomicrobiales bacterium]